MKKEKYKDASTKLDDFLVPMKRASPEKKHIDVISDISAKRSIMESVKKNWLYSRQGSLRHTLEKTEIEAGQAFGGRLNIRAAMNAFEIVTLYQTSTSLADLSEIILRDLSAIRERD